MTATSSNIQAGIVVRARHSEDIERHLASTPGRERRETTIVFWVYRDCEGVWWVRKEGGEITSRFAGRKDALAFARTLGERWGSYHIFFVLDDGRTAEEMFNLGGR